MNNANIKPPWQQFWLKAKFTLRFVGLYLGLGLITRLAYLFYYPEDQNLTFFEIITAFFIGLRFDLALFALLNILFVAILFLPFQRMIIVKTLGFLMIVPVLLVIFLTIADYVYYPLVRHKLGNEVLLTLQNFSTVFIMSVKDYWHGWLAIIATCYLGFWSSHRYFLKPFFQQFAEMKKNSSGRLGGLGGFGYWVVSFLLWAIVVVLLIIALRGGVQMRPLQTLNAYQNEKTFLGDLALPGAYTALTALYLQETPPIHDPNYREQGDKIFELLNNGREEKIDANYIFLRKQKVREGEIRRKVNVFIIILESVSATKMAYFGQKGNLTENLDSLVDKSLFFKNAFASGQRSIVSLPAIISSMPSTDRQVFLMSPFQTYKHYSVASVLKNHGYRSYFAHGAKGGSMGFSAYAKAQGFDEIIEAETVGMNKENSDGLWGVFDEFTAQALNEAIVKNSSKQPFVAVFYSLNPHSPYTIPAKYAQDSSFLPATTDTTNRRGKKLPYDFARSLKYADLVLKNIFTLAQKNAYFDDTLFIVTSDHTHGQDVLEDIFRVPLMFYAPKLIKPFISGKMASHLDILPSVLDFLNVEAVHSSAGKSLFRTKTEHDFVFFDFWHEMGFIYENVLSLYNNGKLTHSYQIDKPFALSDSSKQQHRYVEQNYQPLWLALHSALGGAKLYNQIAK